MGIPGLAMGSHGQERIEKVEGVQIASPVKLLCHAGGLHAVIPTETKEPETSRLVVLVASSQK